MTNFEDCLVEALDTVLAWDLPEDCWFAAVNARAALLSGVEAEAAPLHSVD